MFTGIVEEVGAIHAISKVGDIRRLSVKAPILSDSIKIGDSVSVNGVCLTVTDKKKDVLCFDAVGETVKRTTLGELREKDKVNLEDALRVGEPLGGHFVLGHIDCVGRVVSFKKDAENISVEVGVSEDFRYLIVKKGSVAIDGVSLTVTDVKGDRFRIYLIPHTLKATTLILKKAGDSVNVEFDVLGKYMTNVKEAREGGGRVTEKFLEENGFI